MALLKDLAASGVEVARKVARSNNSLQVVARAARNVVIVGPLGSTITSFYQQKVRERAPMQTNSLSFYDKKASTHEMSDSLERLGWAEGFAVKPEYVKEIKDWADTKAYQRVNPHAHHALLWDMAHNDTIIEVVRSYLGAEPVLHGCYLEWTQPSRDTDDVETLENARKFHYDTGDFRSVTAWFYLNDVDDDAAPHVCIGGTHRDKRTFKNLVMPWVDNKKAAEIYGDRIHKFVGPAGFAWFEDLSVFHRRAKCLKPRLTLSFSYVLTRTPMTENIPQEIAGVRPADSTRITRADQPSVAAE